MGARVKLSEQRGMGTSGGRPKHVTDPKCKPPTPDTQWTKKTHQFTNLPTTYQFVERVHSGLVQHGTTKQRNDPPIRLKK